MNTRTEIGSPPFIRFAPFLAATGGVLLLLFFFLDQSQITLFQSAVLRVVLLLSVGAAACVGAARYLSGRLTLQQAVFLMLAGALFLRILYMTATPYTIRQHDVEGLGGQGHLGYMQLLWETGTLPQSDDWQFYQPPLHHIISALWVKAGLLLGFSVERCVENIQLLTVFYSMAILVVLQKILAYFRLSPVFQLCALLFAAFHPTMLYMSSGINNDILMLLFFLLALLFAIRWYYRQTFGNILVLALCIGLGMMTKLSCGIVAVLVAPVLLYGFLKSRKKGRLAGQFAAFGAVCVPLGLWYSVRNFLRFGQPFGYVPMLPEDSFQYVGNYSVFQRLFSLPFDQFTGSPYVSVADDHNIPMYVVKNSLFGEASYQSLAPFAWVLVYANLAMLLLIAAAFVYCLVKGFGRGPRLPLALLVGNVLLQAASYLNFCFQMPHACTMDVRYMASAILCGGFFLALAGQRITEQAKRPIRWPQYACVLVVGLFSFGSALFYALV